MRREPLVRAGGATCDAPAMGGPCVLPRGHNMGKPDVPGNHRAIRDAQVERASVADSTRRTRTTKRHSLRSRWFGPKWFRVSIWAGGSDYEHRARWAGIYIPGLGEIEIHLMR